MSILNVDQISPIGSGSTITVTATETKTGAITIGTGSSIFSPAGNTLVLGTNNLERIRIKNDGKVGIGTNNPTAKLEIKGSDNPLVKIVQDTSGIARLNLESATNDGYQYSGIGLGDGTNDAELMWTTGGFDINVGNAVRLRINSNGAWGAGTNFGSAGQVLTSQGSGSAVQWATPAAPFGGALDGMIFGGVETTYTSGGTTYKVHTFTSTGFLRVTAAISMNFLIVGGGGGTAAAELSYGATGGGGAGGMVEGTGITIPVGKHTITVGQGGAASNAYNVAGSGGDSSFSYGGTTVTAKGGGGSPDYATTGTAGGSGSGGSEPNGAAGASTQSSQNSGISNIQQFGNAGGAAAGYTSGAGGGGGAGGAGQARSAGGAGGSGRANSITGSSVTYAVGGNGGATGYANGSAGTNGRGNGASGATSSHPNEGQGAAGGSGIVIVRYVFS